jgi:hypothetical protein
MSPKNPVTAYALSVRAGVIIAGHAVRQACERHLRDLVDGPARGLRFSRQAVDRVLRFSRRCASRRRPCWRAIQALPVASPRRGEFVRMARPWRLSALPQRIPRGRKGIREDAHECGDRPVRPRRGQRTRAQALIGATTRDQAGICYADAHKMVGASPMPSAWSSAT